MYNVITSASLKLSVKDHFSSKTIKSDKKEDKESTDMSLTVTINYKF